MENTEITISEKYIGLSGVTYILEWIETSTLEHLEQNLIKQAYAVAYDTENPSEIIIVHNRKKDTWGLIGGSVEEDENPDETLVREIYEESGYRTLAFKLLGAQKMTDTRDDTFIYQLRYVAKIYKESEFTEDFDPAGTVDRIKFIHPTDHKNYFDWRSIGDRIFELAEHNKNLI